MKDRKTQVLFERVEIPITMQPDVAVGQTKRCDQAIHHFADSLPFLSKAS